MRAQLVELTPLRRWRLDNGLSLEEVSGLVGLSISVLSRVERGQAGLKPLTKIRLARRLGVRVEEIFPPEPLPEEGAVA